MKIKFIILLTPFIFFVAGCGSANLPQSTSSEGDEIGEPAFAKLMNMAAGSLVSASKNTESAGLIVDGDRSSESFWSSEAEPMQWVEIDLGESADIYEIKLYVFQFPEGNARHQILGKSKRDDNFTQLHVFDDNVATEDVLSFSPESPWRNVRFVRVETLDNPETAFVEWSEIEIIGIPTGSQLGSEEKQANSGTSPDIILHNAKLLTMDAANKGADAIAIQNELIYAVGSSEEILAMATANSKIIDMEGLSITPGFIDSHSHRMTQRHKWGFETPAEASAEAVSQGWTELVELSVDEDQLQSLIAASEADELHARINAYLIVNSVSGEALGDWYHAYSPGQQFGSHLRIAGLKVFIDQDSGRILLWGQEALNSFIAERAGEGWKITIKAISIQAHELALGAFDHAIELFPDEDFRFRIEHSAAASDEQVERMASAGYIPSIQPSFPGVIWNEEDIRNLGEEEGQDNLFRWRDYEEAGLTIISSPYNPPGSDAEYTNATHMSPMGLIYRSLTQIGLGNAAAEDWMFAKTLSLDELLKSLSISGAYALFQEDIKGSITEGKLADLVVFSANPLTTMPADFLTIETVFTMVGGEIGYCSIDWADFCP